MIRRLPRSRGFTLIELMVVVAIVAILATLAVYGVRKYVLAAKSSEAAEIIQAVKGGQEAYKDETFTYLSISANLDSLFPLAKSELGNKKVNWTSGNADELKKWRMLGVTPNAPVQFGYACIAGNGGTLPTQGIPAELNYPSSPGGPWYVVKAYGDRDDDDDYASFIGSSFTDALWSDNDTE